MGEAVKNYLHDVFVKNWQTTSVGLTTLITTVTQFVWAWTHPLAGQPAAMPNPESYLASFLAALFLIFKANDSAAVKALPEVPKAP